MSSLLRELRRRNVFRVGVAYLAARRQTLPAVACGDDGFKSWQPLPETCATRDQRQ